MLEEFNKYFSHIGENLAAKFKSDDAETYKLYLTKKSSPLPISVDNATGTIDVADHWRSHYEFILNSSAQGGLTDNLFVQNAIGNSSSFHNIPNLLCTVDFIHIWCISCHLTPLLGLIL